MPENINGCILSDVYITGIGEPIKFGDEILLHFAGGPVDMPSPWILVSGEMINSSVGFYPCPSITVQASNGNQMTFDHAEMYNPHGIDTEKYFQVFLDDPCHAFENTLRQFTA